MRGAAVATIVEVEWYKEERGGLRGKEEGKNRALVAELQ